MEKNRSSRWEDDFREFLQAESREVPAALSESVRGSMHALLNPSPLRVFGKVLLIQFIIGTASLLICPQFGVSLGSGHGLMHYLMRFGSGVCMLGCGAIFTGASLFLAGTLLKTEEVRALRSHRFLHMASVATLSLGAFLCVGGEIVASLGIIWLAGAILGGLATLEAGWKLRRWSYERGFA